jgi:RNA polymerase sigma-70 factor (TIGR02943 family)
MMKPMQLPQKNQTHDPGMWVKLYNSYLQRFALSRINNPEIVKDLVQETFLAALAALGNFQQRSSVRTWLTSILKNKIVDYYRTCQRELVIEDIDFDAISIDEIFGGPKRWSAWSNRVNFNPVNSFEQMEFFEVFYHCLARLPIRLAYIFILHTFVGLSTDEICNDLNISKTNCWVMLHRARKLLRLSLEAKWISA